MKAYRCEECGEEIGPNEVQDSEADDVEGYHDDDCGGVVEKVPQKHWPRRHHAQLRLVPDSTMFMRETLGEAEADDGAHIEIARVVGGGVVMRVSHPEVETDSVGSGEQYAISISELAAAAHESFKTDHGFICTGCGSERYGEPERVGPLDSAGVPKYELCAECADESDD